MVGLPRLTFSNALLAVGFAYFLFIAWTLTEVFFPSACQSNCLKPAWGSHASLSIDLQWHEFPSSHTNSSFRSEPFILENGYNIQRNVSVPEKVFHNKTITAKLTIYQESEPIWSELVPVTSYKEPNRNVFDLLANENSSDISAAKGANRSVNFWLSTLRVYILKTPVVLEQFSLPPELYPHVKTIFNGSEYVYLPIVYVNPEMQKTTDWIQVPTPMILNNGTSEYPLLKFDLAVESQSVGTFRLRCMVGMLAIQLRSYGFRSKDVDEVRQLLVDTNFYFLLTTMFISIFHIIFDFLAFKNDISFWRQTKDTTGLSTCTVIWRFVSSLIITLHLWEERSSLLVIVPMGVSTCIELWKFARICKFSVSFQGGFQLGLRTKKEVETDRLDAQFMFWLQILMLPLCLIGAIYSLVYTPHRSWYSWCLQTLVHGVYSFGFLFMTPQLFINYRLKSVAHLPWKALTYKALNTFIDDFFAMIIVMPTSHRIACLRDDVVFLVYIYQRWLYPVDKSRVNEFGLRGDHDENKPKVELPEKKNCPGTVRESSAFSCLRLFTKSRTQSKSKVFKTD